MKKNYETPLMEIIDCISEKILLADSGVNNGTLIWGDEADFEI